VLMLPGHHVHEDGEGLHHAVASSRCHPPQIDR
jgi:hypothetical protein